MGAPCCSSSQPKPGARSTVRAVPEGSRGAPPSPHAHTQSSAAGVLLPERYTSLLPAEKTPAGDCPAHTPQPGTPTTAPGCSSHGTAGQGGEPGTPPGPARPGSPGAPVRLRAAAAGGSPGAASWRRLSWMVRLSKLTLAHVGPALERPNVRRAPSCCSSWVWYGDVV